MKLLLNRKNPLELVEILTKSSLIDSGGCPVIKGNKWSSTKWFHVHEY